MLMKILFPEHQKNYVNFIFFLAISSLMFGMRHKKNFSKNLNTIKKFSLLNFTAIKIKMSSNQEVLKNCEEQLNKLKYFLYSSSSSTYPTAISNRMFQNVRKKRKKNLNFFFLLFCLSLMTLLRPLSPLLSLIPNKHFSSFHFTFNLSANLFYVIFCNKHIKINIMLPFYKGIKRSVYYD